MKSLLLIALTLSITACSSVSRQPEDSTATSNQTGSTTGTYASEPAPVYEGTGSDSIGTSQSSTLRDDRNYRESTTTTCVDRSGRSYYSTDAGYAACRNSMKR